MRNFPTIIDYKSILRNIPKGKYNNIIKNPRIVGKNKAIISLFPNLNQYINHGNQYHKGGIYNTYGISVYNMKNRIFNAILARSQIVKPHVFPISPRHVPIARFNTGKRVLSDIKMRNSWKTRRLAPLTTPKRNNNRPSTPNRNTNNNKWRKLLGNRHVR